MVDNVKIGIVVVLLLIVGYVLRHLSTDGFFMKTHGVTRFTGIDNPAYGHVYVLDKDDIISNVILDNRIWEEHICRKMADLYVPGTDMLDIGANMGLNTLRMHKIKPITGKAHLFEPQFDCFGALEYNTREMPREIYNLCLSDRYDMLSYSKNQDNVGATSMTNPENNHIKVASIPLDSIRFPNKVSLVKMDVEGAEAHVLKGGRGFFETHKPALIIELLNHNKENMLPVLKDMNYVLVEHLGGEDYLYKHALAM